MSEIVSVHTVQEVTKVNIENAPDQQRNTVTVVEDQTDVFVSLVGIQGARGYGFVSGANNPTSADGRVGDFYINTTNNSFWGPKTTSGWPASPFFVPGTTTRHVHTQASPSSTWTINHTLGGYPSVMVVDSASTVVIGEVLYISTTQVQVSFTAPFSGFAYLT
jgi:hypothetical protein